MTTKNNEYYFANCIQSENRAADFESARTEVSLEILQKLNIL